MQTRINSEVRSAIQALTAEHAYRIDHGQADTLHELFTVNGELLGLPPKDLVGRDSIADWGIERVKLERISRHVETNHRLFEDDGVLRGTVCATVYRADADDTTMTAPFMIGDYEDEYQQEDGVWKFRKRVIRRAFRIKP